MSAKDKFHDAVKHALEKEGWQITHDPLTFEGVWGSDKSHTVIY